MQIEDLFTNGGNNMDQSPRSQQIHSLNFSSHIDFHVSIGPAFFLVMIMIVISFSKANDELVVACGAKPLT